MRRLVVMLIVFCTESVIYAQLGWTCSTASSGVAPVPFYGPSTSVIGRTSNLLVFDVL